ncbi:MAG TPA: hypothetical protein VGM90_28700 [Kofleriaceae bacterium]|jgi:hypothetical protein
MAKSTVKPWHILAAMFGVPALALGLGGEPYGAGMGVVLPVVGALMVGWLLWQFLPKVGVGALIVAVGAIGTIRLSRHNAAEREEIRNRGRTYAMAGICDGKAMTLAPGKRAKIRVMNLYTKDGEKPTWLDDQTWDVAMVPDFMLCVKESQQEVASGKFSDDAHPESPPMTISTSRFIEDVELRKVPSAEVVFTKHYVGGDPPPLPTVITFGGGQNTDLTGSRFDYGDYYEDIKQFLK